MPSTIPVLFHRQGREMPAPVARELQQEGLLIEVPGHEDVLTLPDTETDWSRPRFA